MQSTFEDPLDAVPLAMVPADLPAGPVERDRLHIRDILKDCVTAFSAGHVAAANAALEKLSHVASSYGGPLQRVTSAFSKALAHHVHKQPQLPKPALINAAQYKFGSLCPLLGVVAAAAVNYTIVQMMEGERDVHVVDLGGANTSQWLELLRLFAARPGGAPRLRLTIVSDQETFLSFADRLFTQEAIRLQIQFVFNPVRSQIAHFSPANVAALGVVCGQALAITSTLQLHCLIADVIAIELPAAAHDKKGKKKTVRHQITKADALLRVLHDLQPKVMLLTEQEADHNSANLWDRVRNAFDYYSALFCDLEAGGGSAGDRAAVEQLLLQEEIMDIVTHDGASRRERHEKMLRWAPRMCEAGFELAQVRFDVYWETASLAHKLSGSGNSNERLYRVVKNNGCFYFYSRMTLIFAVSVWQPRSIGK